MSASEVERYVSAKIREARKLRCWTQGELGQRLEKAMGRAWSTASVSLMETQTRRRQFDVGLLTTLSQVLDMPLSFFFPQDEARYTTRLEREVERLRFVLAGVVSTATRGLADA